MRIFRTFRLKPCVDFTSRLIGVDEAFQEICGAVTEANGGKYKRTPIKGHARMLNKCQGADDHRYLELPRPLHNIDINRNACTFDTVDELLKAGVCFLLFVWESLCAASLFVPLT